MFIDISPLRRYPKFRLLYIGQSVSAFGTQITMVALPYHVYQLTKSSMWVGLIGVAELAPLFFTALLGGAVADSMDRKRLIIGAEAIFIALLGLLAWNSSRPEPSLALVFTIASAFAAVNGFHRPALESLTPRLVDRDSIPAVAALNSLRGTLAMIAGPALAGVLMAHAPIAFTFLLDAFSFLIAIACVFLARDLPAPETITQVGWKSIVEGFRYAKSRQELVGTYAIDFVAMVFGMPMALFPAMGEALGGPKAVGMLYSAPAVGAALVTLTSGWVKKVHRHGAAVAIAASTWGFAIACFGLSQNLTLALFFLAFAGGADMVSGIFRSTMWNQTIPDSLRGRLAGIEMLSYMSGPMLGNATSGLMGSLIGVRVAIATGGLLCIGAVVTATKFLPQFWDYSNRTRTPDLSEIPLDRTGA